MKHTIKKLKLKKLKKKYLTKKVQKGGNGQNIWTCIDLSLVICPISHSIMFDPVLAEDGNTYERSFIEEWFRKKQTSPLTNKHIGKHLTSNRAVKQLIDNVINALNDENSENCKKKYVDINLLKDLIEDYNFNINLKDLHIACRDGNIDKVQLLIKNGVNVNTRDENHGMTPLLIVCYSLPISYSLSIKIARLLLDNGAEVNQTNKDGTTPLYITCQKGHVDMARLLLEKGAKVNQTNKYGITPLLIACHKGHVDTARLLLEKGAEVDQTDKYDCTPLWIACQKGHVDTARLLLDNGAEVNLADRNGYTPLHVACEKDQVDIARLLLDNGAEVARSTKEGFTPLHAACQKGRVDAARLLLDNGADVNPVDTNGFTPLHVACSYGHIDIARLLLDNGADSNIENNAGLKPLDITIHEDVVKLLQEHDVYLDFWELENQRQI